MSIFKRFIQLAEGKVTMYKKSLACISLMSWLIPISAFVFMLLPNLTFSQQDTTYQEIVRSLQEAVNNSPIIIEAQVISKECKWDSSKGKRGMITSIKFKILQTIKGVVESNEFTFDQPGGKVGNTIVEVSSSKDYDLNERAIYFIQNKDLTGYLQEGRAIIKKNGLIDIGDEHVDADLFIKVIKKSVTDASVLPRFANMLTKMKEAREELKVHPHKGIVIPNPLDDIKDTVRVDSTQTKKAIQPYMLHRVQRPNESIKDTVKQE